MRPDMLARAELALFAFGEAAHCGGYNPMLAVACVMRNRIRAGWHGGDWFRAIAHAHESAALHTYRLPEEIDPAFGRLLQEVDDIFLGTYKDELTEGGLYYMDTAYTQHGQELRPWFAEKILRDQENHPRIAQVGMLQIFR